jgi:multimeric flavodoxin WrbA
MGTASTAFHAFAETGSKRWFSHVRVDKLAAGFTNSGAKSGDKASTLGYFVTLAAQHGMHWISVGLLPGWGSTTEHLGARVARQAAIFRAGRPTLPA